MSRKITIELTDEESQRFDQAVACVAFAGILKPYGSDVITPEAVAKIAVKWLIRDLLAERYPK